ncbi:MAG: TetR/AcrR family transcriptional regulator [Solirubrobacterales bacterium]
MPSVTRKSQHSRAARRDEIRNRLLEVVERLLQEGESYTEISVERLVSEASISRSTFYVYFQDKGDLVSAWFSGIIKEIEDASLDWAELDGDATWDDLRAALSKIIDAYKPHTTLMAAVYDAAAYDPGVRDLVFEMMDWNITRLRNHIKAGQKAGFVDPDLLPQQTAAWLQWMSERGLHQLVRNAKPAEVERLMDAYTAIVWNTLYAPVRKRR